MRFRLPWSRRRDEAEAHLAAAREQTPHVESLAREVAAVRRRDNLAPLLDAALRGLPDKRGGAT